jgi:hypothetical protein
MVYSPLAVGGFIGVLISGAFVYWEVGRYAAPQVPRSRFNEPKALWAYTAGLFVGVPLAILFRLYQVAVAGGSLLFSGLIDIALLVAAVEIAQAILVRSRYFGVQDATPFYAVSFRAAMAGILIVAEVAGGLEAGITGPGLVVIAAQSMALLAIQVTGALQSISRSAVARQAIGGPLSGVIVGAVSYVVFALGYGLGTWGEVASALLVIAGLVPSYRRLRRRTLDQVVDAEGGPSQRREGPERPFDRRPE